MTTKPKRPSEITRDALRRAVRNHPSWAATMGQPNLITVAELRQLAEDLGLDADRIQQKALATWHATGETPEDTAPTPEDNSTMPLDSAPAAGPAVDTNDTTDVVATISSLRQDILDHGFASVTDRLSALIEAAAKPPVVIEKIVERVIEPPLAVGVHDLAKVRTESWASLFGVTGPLSSRTVTVWDHPNAPKANPHYVFPDAESALALSQMARSDAARAAGAPAKHVLLHGPAGTGKSTWAREFAARTGRPFVSIPLNDGIEMEQLIGQTVLDGHGGTKWQDGLLLSAMRQPGMVICLDEVGGMRPAVGVALNGLLQDMVYFVPDTGERLVVARHVVFIATNNVVLAESGASTGYVGVQRQNRAFADRFGASIEIGYAPAATESALLVAYTGCTPTLADLLVQVAVVTRAKAQMEELTHGIGFRRLLAWAEALTDGNPAEIAFKSCVLNTAPAVDSEPLRQLALVAIDPAAIEAALRGQKPRVLSHAATEFTDVSDEA
jgi:MoxR-like ATPase